MNLYFFAKKVCITPLLICLVATFAGCRMTGATSDSSSISAHPGIKTILMNLDSHGIKLSAPALSHEPGLATAPGVVFVRGSHYFSFHIAANTSSANQLENHVKQFVADLASGKNSLDMAGYMRYYRCDLVFVSYMVNWNSPSDPEAEKALTESCGPAIAQYPQTLPSLAATTTPSQAK